MKLQIVAVMYSEPEYSNTLRAINMCQIPTIFVDRKGVGSLAEAYNRGFQKVTAEYVWFISNISFDSKVPGRLLKSVEGFDGVHPEFDSHHGFIREGKGIQEVKFLEFTAPMIRSEVFKEIQLDENCPYWGHDIIFGIEGKKKGYKFAVDHTTRVDHVYIWDSKRHPITEERKKRRLQTDQPTTDYLNKNYPEWKQYL